MWGVRLVALSAASGAAAGVALDTKASGPKTFYADSRVGNNQMTFFSQSTLEDFTGVCNQIGGQCQLDPKDLDTFKGRFTVRVADMDTGIELRNEHLRSADWMDAEKHPEVVIEVASVADVKKTAADTATMTLVGKCSIRGKTNDVRIPCTLKYLDETPETMRRVKGDLIRLRSEFKLKLSDYGIHGPAGSDIIGLKVSDEIELRVTVFGSTERPPDALAADADQDAQPRRPPPKRP
jgi:polyisoprenoid-binding protein YceI